MKTWWPGPIGRTVINCPIGCRFTKYAFGAHEWLKIEMVSNLCSNKFIITEICITMHAIVKKQMNSMALGFHTRIYCRDFSSNPMFPRMRSFEWFPSGERADARGIVGLQSNRNSVGSSALFPSWFGMQNMHRRCQHMMDCFVIWAWFHTMEINHLQGRWDRLYLWQFLPRIQSMHRPFETGSLQPEPFEWQVWRRCCWSDETEKRIPIGEQCCSADTFGCKTSHRNIQDTGWNSHLCENMWDNMPVAHYLCLHTQRQQSVDPLQLFGQLKLYDLPPEIDMFVRLKR